MSNYKETTTEAFNIKEFILTAFSYKYLYIASIIFFLAIAFVINKIAPTVYEVSSVIGPVEDKRSSLLESNDLFRGLGTIAESKNLQNDINSLNSFSLVSGTLSKLNLEIGYYTENKTIVGQKKQIYPAASYTVTVDKSHIQPINAKFYVDILDEKSFRLKSSEDNVSLYNYVDNLIVSEKNVLRVDTICSFNSTIKNPYFKFSVFLNPEQYRANLKNKNLKYFEFYHLDFLAKEYLEKLNIQPVNLKSSLIRVYFRGKNLDLTIDFLNSYLKDYLDDNLSKKNKTALSTIKFIDSQISEISDSLLKSESKLKDYRSSNQVTNLTYQGQQALEQMTKIESDKSALQVQERYYKYIQEYLEKNQDVAGIAPPSSANVVDPLMTSLVTELLSLGQQRATILSNNAGKNLFLGQIENKINLQKQQIIENVRNSLNTLTLTQNELNYRAERLSGEISKLPRTELNMVSMQRKYNLSDAIYTFLLQKRSEAQITMYSNNPDYEILEPARQVANTVISPKKVFNLMIAVFLALIFPTAFVIIKSFFNEKITRIYDVESLLNRPVLSIIYSNSYKSESVVADFPGSSVAESFRNLRSSLFLRFKSEPLKVIMITSSQPQDGKSFISFNLASSIASVGYKTIILDCDLRRPTLHEKFKSDNSIGLSTYMVNNSTADEIIVKTDIKNLSFIPAGPILPNSAELIESGALDDLIKYLKSKYEYVIIDTTPAGLVADATLMMKYANLNLLICRNNYTRKDVFRNVLSVLTTNRIENFDVIFNDLSMKKSRYGRYNDYYKKI
jgi:capsular exopolysaccharide synthesis family protein